MSNIKPGYTPFSNNLVRLSNGVTLSQADVVDYIRQHPGVTPLEQVVKDTNVVTRKLVQNGS